MSSDVLQQVEKRRTFAIISHPDAGKTTITEKLLLGQGLECGDREREEVGQIRDVRLDGTREVAGHFDHDVSDAVPVPGSDSQPAGHARS